MHSDIFKMCTDFLWIDMYSEYDFLRIDMHSEYENCI